MRAWDVDQAYLHDFPREQDAHMAVASFLVAGPTGDSNSSAIKNSATGDSELQGEQMSNPIAAELAKFL